MEKIERLKAKLYAGMAMHGITEEVADEIYARIQAFANFGFAESHAISFALLVYASSWLKLHYPGAFLAGLLRAQPMGFYSPQSLVADARRHGVEVRRPDIAVSGVDADLEPLRLRGRGREPAVAMAPGGMDSCRTADQPQVGPFRRGAPDRSAEHRRDGAAAVRLGLTSVNGIGRTLAEKIVAERDRQPYADMNDVVRRAGLTVAQTEALATAGAFDTFGLSRRQALWNAGYADSLDTLPGTAVDAAPPELPGMSDVELTLADLWATKISPGEHPIAHLRAALEEQGIRPVGSLGEGDDTRRVRVAGTGHPPAAPGHGRWGHLPQPRGRDRDAQHRLLGADVEAVPPDRPAEQRPGHPGSGRVRRRGDQPGRRPVRPVGGVLPQSAATVARSTSRDFH